MNVPFENSLKREFESAIASHLLPNFTEPMAIVNAETTESARS